MPNDRLTNELTSVGHSSVRLYRRLFDAPAPKHQTTVPRQPHWWAPFVLNRVLHWLGYPLGSVAARATINLRRAVGSVDLAPKVFVRVDDYPHWTVSTDRFWEFHAALQEHRVHYLLGATPFLATEPLTPRSRVGRSFDENEWTRLAVAFRAGELEVGLHGVTHRTHSDGMASEFDGLHLDEARRSIGRAWNWLAERGLAPMAFIPPFNRLPTQLWSALPSDCSILCLGPESLRDVPLLWSPAALDHRIVVYSLAPFYGRADRILDALLSGHWLETEGSIVPITLHWTWEVADGFRAVSRLARHVAGFVSRWSTLRTAVS